MRLASLLDGAAVCPEFRKAVLDFEGGGPPSERLQFSALAPRVKVERTLIKILTTYASLPISSVSIMGRSGCEFFRGEAMIRTPTEERRVEFDWDCRWKALQLGWTDYFGFPDQTRAAREFGFDCFRSWLDEPVRLLV